MQGLFARIPLYAGEVAAFYNGVRVPHELVDARDWDANENTISLDEDTVIDVPAALAGTAAYTASLGHKANHRSPVNAVYAPMYHPRFGDIKCVRCVCDVPAGDELTVDYGYHGDHGYPAWWSA